MRKTALIAGVISCAFILSTNSGHANAETLDHIESGSPEISNQLRLIGLLEESNESSELDQAEAEAKAKKQADAIKQAEAAAKKPTVHVVAENESLSDIAKKYNTTWIRLYAKNTNIDQPDMVAVGDKIVIPLADEQLADRALPEPPVQEVAPVSRGRASTTASTRQSAPAASSSVRIARGSSAGNTYSYGYCTWYVKNRRPDIPNGLGNAITWVSRASAMGLSTGSTPRAGAVGQQGNHVVYVERVNGDGTVTVSEMNFRGFNVTSSRTVPASNFSYIY